METKNLNIEERRKVDERLVQQITDINTALSKYEALPQQVKEMQDTLIRLTDEIHTAESGRKEREKTTFTDVDEIKKILYGEKGQHGMVTAVALLKKDVGRIYWAVGIIIAAALGYLVNGWLA